MSSFELNKIAGAVLVGLLAFVVIGHAGDMLYGDPGASAGDVHGDGAISVAATGGHGATAGATAEPATVAEPIGVLLASASLDAGQTQARKCAACHTFDQGGSHRVGPNLWNIVGNMPAMADGYSYSDAMQADDQPWTFENLDAFLASPRTYVPGTKMNFAGIRKAEDRADLILYLRSLSNAPVALP
ncbi:MAG: cytochrome c family protein [Alphaproteobacteria bacterium]